LFAALLRISQVEAGTRLSSFAKVSVSELLGNVRDFYRPLAEDRQHRLDADIGAGLEIQGDAELLFQLFSNLIENAIRHTPAGTNILIEGRPTPEGIKVVVHDDGPGIPEQEYPKITRRFYRLSSSRSEPGNGLGLALVSAIASLHGARMAFLDGNPGLSVKLLFSPTGPVASP
jgi:signal transduction histidine kinase